jgi:hypothetical protein
MRVAVRASCFSLLTSPLLVSLFKNEKVAGSIPDEVDFFNGHNPSSGTRALGSTQPLTEMGTINLPEG